MVPSVLNCNYSEAIETNIQTGIHTNMKFFLLKVRNYKELGEFILKPLRKILIEGDKYETFSIQILSKDEFKVIIRNA